jgi:hypothetical protein
VLLSSTNISFWISRKIEAAEWGECIGDLREATGNPYDGSTQGRILALKGGNELSTTGH